jgi:hypothetical protein
MFRGKIKKMAPLYWGPFEKLEAEFHELALVFTVLAGVCLMTTFLFLW